ncbi:hypothetical protein LTR16_011798, partial [Cryomyces antarcticus]
KATIVLSPSRTATFHILTAIAFYQQTPAGARPTYFATVIKHHPWARNIRNQPSDTYIAGGVKWTREEAILVLLGKTEVEVAIYLAGSDFPGVTEMAEDGAAVMDQ